MLKFWFKMGTQTLSLTCNSTADPGRSSIIFSCSSSSLPKPPLLPLPNPIKVRKKYDNKLLVPSPLNQWCKTNLSDSPFYFEKSSSVLPCTWQADSPSSIYGPVTNYQTNCQISPPDYYCSYRSSCLSCYYCCFPMISYDYYHPSLVAAWTNTQQAAQRDHHNHWSRASTVIQRWTNHLTISVASATEGSSTRSWWSSVETLWS